ncbi:MAG: hypothetical protein WD751_03620 [Anaerolineales bacterium]
MNKQPSGMSFLLYGILMLPVSVEHPYLDPGSGSFILQMIIAGLAGFGYIMRSQISNFFRRFRRSKKEEEKKDQSPNE